MQSFITLLGALLLFSFASSSASALNSQPNADNSSSGKIQTQYTDSNSTILPSASSNAKLPYLQMSDAELDTQIIAWSQWLTHIPDDKDIFADRTGMLCALGQKGDVWYLTGSYSSGKINRKCTIPRGKKIFVPISSASLWDNAEGAACSFLKQQVQKQINATTRNYFELDGKKLQDISAFRRTTEKCFKLTVDNEIYANDGYWIMLQPLAPGEHSIKFGHDALDAADGGNIGQNIEYKLLVE